MTSTIRCVRTGFSRSPHLQPAGSLRLYGWCVNCRQKLDYLNNLGMWVHREDLVSNYPSRCDRAEPLRYEIPEWL